jgi:hypothetical protein
MLLPDREGQRKKSPAKVLSHVMRARAYKTAR